LHKGQEPRSKRTKACPMLCYWIVGCGSTLCVCQQSKVRLLVIAVYREDCRLLKRCPYATDDLENAVEILKDKNI